MRFYPLTPAMEPEVRRRWAAGESGKVIARALGVRVDAVWRVKKPARSRPVRCPRRHPYTEANTYVRERETHNKDGSVTTYTARECRTCRAMTEAAAYYDGRRYRGRKALKRRHPRVTPEQAARSVEARRRQLWE